MKIKLTCDVPVSKELGLIKGKILEVWDKNGDYETKVGLKDGRKIDVVIFNREAEIINN